MAKAKDAPKIEEISKEQLDSMLQAINDSSLPQHVKDFINKCITIALWFSNILQKKNITLSRLRTMIFGKGYTSKSTDQTKPSSDKLVNENSAPSTTTEMIESTVNPHHQKPR